MGFTATSPKGGPLFTDTAQTVADLNEGRRFTEEVGNRKIGTTAQRNAATGSKVWKGLEWYDTDLNLLFLHNGTTFVVADAQRRIWEFKRVSGLAADSFGSGTFAEFVAGTITGALPGDYSIHTTAILENSTQNIGYYRVLAAGINLTDDMRCDPRATTPTVVSHTGSLEAYAGGNLAVSLSAQVAAGTGTVYKNGTAIRVVYHGRRT